jgi:hypothetical protein
MVTDLSAELLDALRRFVDRRLISLERRWMMRARFRRNSSRR